MRQMLQIMNMLRQHPLHYSVHSRLRCFHLERLLASRPEGLLLDVGCGLGYLTQALGGRRRCVGLDYDAGSLKHGADVGNQRVRGDASRLPFQDGVFDVVICSELLEHLPEGLDDLALAEMARALKPGGLLLITVPALEGLRAQSPLRNLGHDDPSGGEYHHRIGYSAKRLKEMVADVPGLRVVYHRYAMFLLSELFMDLLKLVYFRKNKLTEHSDIMASKKSLLFRVYRRIFPLLHAVFIVEDMIFARLLQGHIHILALAKGA